MNLKNCHIIVYSDNQGEYNILRQIIQELPIHLGDYPIFVEGSYKKFTISPYNNDEIKEIKSQNSDLRFIDSSYDETNLAYKNSFIKIKRMNVKKSLIDKINELEKNLKS